RADLERRRVERALERARGADGRGDEAGREVGHRVVGGERRDALLVEQLVEELAARDRLLGVERQVEAVGVGAALAPDHVLEPPRAPRRTGGQAERRAARRDERLEERVPLLELFPRLGTAVGQA